MDKLPPISDALMEFLEESLNADRLLEAAEEFADLSEAGRYGFIIGARAAVGALRAAKTLQEADSEDED